MPQVNVAEQRPVSSPSYVVGLITGSFFLNWPPQDAEMRMRILVLKVRNMTVSYEYHAMLVKSVK